jgi:hypothetical protein
MSQPDEEREQQSSQRSDEIHSYQLPRYESSQTTAYDSIGSQDYVYSQASQQSEFKGVLQYTQDEFGNTQERYYFTQDEDDRQREEQESARAAASATATQTESEAGSSCFGSDPIRTPRPILNWPSQPGDLGTPTNTQVSAEPQHEYEWNSQEGSFKY